MFSNPYFILFALPGFISVWTFRFFYMKRSKLTGWEWTWWSIFWGIAQLMLWQWLARDNPDFAPAMLANPISAAMAQAIISAAVIATPAIILITIRIIWVGLTLLWELLFG